MKLSGKILCFIRQSIGPTLQCAELLHESEFKYVSDCKACMRCRFYRKMKAVKTNDSNPEPVIGDLISVLKSMSKVYLKDVPAKTKQAGFYAVTSSIFLC